MLQDLRFAFRLLVKERWFSAVAIVALSLGIGLNATVFTLVNAVLIRGLPFEDSQNLYMLGWQHKRGGRNNVSYPEFKEWREQSKAFSGLGRLDEPQHDDQRRPRPAGAGAGVLSHGERLLGGRPAAAARARLRPEDEKRGTDRAVIIGYRIWRNRYAGDPGIVGKLTRVNGEPAVIVGVMPEGMMFPQNTEIWAVFIPTEQQERRTWRGLERLRPRPSGHQPPRGDHRAEHHRRTHQGGVSPKDYEELTGASIETFNERFNGGPIRAVFLAMMGAVAFVLLIACANVANLLLARSASRAREVAVRLALGATRWRVVRQLLVEAVLLGSIGGVLGLGHRHLRRARVRRRGGRLRQAVWIQFTIDYTVIGFLAGVCVLTGVLFGLAPALHVSRTNVHGVLKEGGAATPAAAACAG